MEPLSGLKYATILIGFHINYFPYKSCFTHFNLCLAITTHNFKGDLWIIMSLYGVIGYHVTLSEGHMIANHPI